MKKLSAAAALGLALGLTGVSLTAEPVSAYPSSALELVGHGYGHGRGMSQYGALGSALQGSDYGSILAHYYSNTTPGTAVNGPIGVRIISNDAADMIIKSGGTFGVGGQVFSPNTAARVRKVGSNTFAIDRSGGCAGEGGWQNLSTVGGPVVASPPTDNPGNDINGMLQRCAPEGARAYRGNFQAIDDSGTARVVNNVRLEDYLRGVVPRESPASWGDLGGGAGMNALRAQSVAARSYSIASPSYSYATTCDTTSCQVYGGAFLNGAYIEDPRTNTAIADTSGQVRKFGSAVARTEFSSSSGGWTAGGTFPAVIDPFDNAGGRNSNSTWTASVSVASVQSSYPSIGQLVSVGINSRNGLGDFGGRVLSMTLQGTSGSVSVSGEEFRSRFGLKSSWFQVSSTPSGGVNGYWLSDTAGGVFSFGGAPFKGSAGNLRLASPIVGMAATPSSAGYWLVAGDGGIFSYGDAGFFGSAGNIRLNSPVVGMARTPGGGGYWLVAGDGGIFSYGNAGFKGSTGNIRLNQPVFGMAATPDGNGYWLFARDGGVFAFGSAGFFGSTGNIRLQQPIVAMASTPDGGGYWLLGADGGIFAFGNARYQGGLPGSNIRKSATAIAPTRTGNGYLITTSDGMVYPYGDAPQFGGVPSVVPGYRGHVVGIAPTG